MKAYPSSRSILLILAFGLWSGWALHAQDIHQQVLASSGREVKQGPLQVSFTVGEIAVQAGHADTLFLTQGYQQAFPLGSTAIGDPEADVSIRVFPNPFADRVYIGLSGMEPVGPAEFRWTDAAGHEVSRQSLWLTPGTDQVLEPGDLPAGTYTLQVALPGRSGLWSAALIRLKP